MNSYPVELLMQLAPVMFVAGLDPRPPPVQDSQSDGSSSPLSSSTPIARRASDPFALLIQRLREALASQRRQAVWIPEETRKGKTFHVVLVDKAIQFPPRKIPPSLDPSSASLPAHSPLSPLTPSSPLYPDGLIAPIWIRKHTALVPAVFVLFLRLYESSPTATSSSQTQKSSILEHADPPDVARAREDREREERRRDAELSREIAERKKSTNERGMKLTVVLIASRRMLEDSSLDGRLTYIRRTGGLDSRAALFVLSPVSQGELLDFVNSLQQALYDPALEYYTNHSKRVRRKRNRHAQSASSVATSIYPHGVGLGINAQGGQTTLPPQPLRPEGWTVRYEYKMACFAEFRGEDEVALKHYQDANMMLMQMFGSTTILPPRTKRWAEAKVLADCINVKICKLYLYNGEHALALNQFNQHLRRFSDLSSRLWSIGEETFEFWSWLARQNRVFAELLEQGSQSTLTFPTHVPSYPSSSPANQGGTPAQQEIDALRAVGLNPNTALQHPGFFYYIAAGCTERRRERFLDALKAEEGGGVVEAPGFANEKKVDHLSTILDLYTKAYELFKKNTSSPCLHSPTQSPVIQPQNYVHGRFTIWIAYRIAQTYFNSQKYDMAIKFFERIAKTYRREQWDHLLTPLLRSWYECTKHFGDTESSIRLLVEIIARGRDKTAAEEDISFSAEDELLSILNNSQPVSSDKPLSVDIADGTPILNSSVLFWSPLVTTDEEAMYQVTFSVPPSTSLSKLPINSLSLYVEGKNEPLIAKRVPQRSTDRETSTSEHFSLVKFGLCEIGLEIKQVVETKFDLEHHSHIVFTGSLSSSIAKEITFDRARLVLSQNGWTIEIPFKIGCTRDEPLAAPRWLSSLKPPAFIPVHRPDVSSVVFKHRPHKLKVTISHTAPAYLGERYPILVTITNDDDRDLDITVEVLLQPGEDDSINQIFFADQNSTALIKGVSFGILNTRETVSKILHLASTGSAGERMLDISVQSRTYPFTSPIARPESPNIDAPDSASPDMNELLQTIEIPVIVPFTVDHKVSYRRKTTGSLPSLGDLNTFDDDFWDDSQGGEAFVITTMECATGVGAAPLTIENVRLVEETNNYSRVSFCSLEDDDFPSTLLPGDQFSSSCLVSLSPPDDDEIDEHVKLPQPGYYEVTWKRSESGDSPSSATTRITLPSFSPPASGLVALLRIDPVGYLHKPLTLELTIRNQHRIRSALPSVQLELDSSDTFVVAGIRSGQLPTLLPGVEQKILWQLFPLECGPAMVLPRVKVYDRRRAEPILTEGSVSEIETQAVEIKVIDVRYDERLEDGSQRWTTSGKALGDGAHEDDSVRYTIMVLPA